VKGLLGMLMNMGTWRLWPMVLVAACTCSIAAEPQQTTHLWPVDDKYLPIYHEFAGVEKFKYGAATLFVPNLDRKTRVVDAYPAKALLDDPKNADALWADLKDNKIKFLIPTTAAGAKFVPVDGKVFTSDANLSEPYKQFLTKYHWSGENWNTAGAFVDGIKTWNDANGTIYIVYSAEPSKPAKWVLEKNRGKAMPYISWAFDDHPKSDQKFYFDLEKSKIGE
jgi:hypothetical protein